LIKVKIGRTEYFVDTRLSQIRAVNNPHNFEDISPEVAAYICTMQGDSIGEKGGDTK